MIRPGGTLPGAALSRRLASAPLVPVRLFLGWTFLYAGVDKLASGTFLRPDGLGSIGAAMAGYVGHSPLGPVVSVALPWAVFVGWLITGVEVAIGLGILTGVALRAAAAAGAALAIVLWLTASWDVHPFYLGADLPVAAGCLALALAGGGEATYPWAAWARRRAAAVRLPLAARGGRILPLALLAAAWAGLGAFRGGSIPGLPAPSPPPSSTDAAEPSRTPPALGLEVGRAADVAADSAVAFSDPTTGAAGVLVRLADGRFVAYDPTCPHASCAVGFDATTGLLVCPCHGATFDPADHGARLSGPTFHALLEYPLAVDPATGTITVRV